MCGRCLYLINNHNYSNEAGVSTAPCRFVIASDAVAIIAIRILIMVFGWLFYATNVNSGIFNWNIFYEKNLNCQILSSSLN